MTVQFTDTTPLPWTWNWSFGDGGTSTEQNPVHTYIEPGTYAVRLTCLTGFDSGPSMERYACETIEVVTPTPMPAMPEASFDYEVIGESYAVRFTDSSTGGPTWWHWDFGDSTTSSEQNPPPHEYSRPGNYSVKLWVSNGGRETRAERVVSVRPTPTVPPIDPPSAAFTWKIDPEGSLRVRYTDVSTGEVNAWNWTFGDDTSSVVKNAIHEYSAPGVYTVSLTVLNAGGDDTTSQVVTVPPPPTSQAIPPTITTVPPTETTVPPIITTIPSITPPIIETPPPGTPPAAAFTWAPAMTNGLRIQFTDTSAGDVTARRWEFGDGNVSYERNPFHFYPVPGEYVVRLTVDGPGGTATAVRNLAVKGLVTPTATPTVTPTTAPPTVTVATATPNPTGGGGGDGSPWWLLPVVAVGLLGGGVAVARWWRGRISPSLQEKIIPGLTIEPRGRLQRPATGQEAGIEIEVRGGIRRER